MSEKKMPFYMDVDGFRIAGAFYAQALRDTIQYKPGADDVFVVTFPKCGTTWMQYLVYLIYHNGEHPNSTKEFMKSSPFLELAGVESIAFMTRPNAMKTHLPFNLQPYSPQAKFIYVVRNPKDCCVSFYYHTKNATAYKFTHGTFDEFFEIFIRGENDYGDYFDHVLSWYEHRNDPNVLFITYEAMKKDIAGSIRKIAGFLGDDYAKMLEEDPTLVDKVIQRSSVEFMKKEFDGGFDEMKDPAAFADILTPALKHVFSHFEANDTFNVVRKGIVGDWRSMFSPEQNRRLTEKMEKRLVGTELLQFWKDINCV